MKRAALSIATSEARYVELFASSPCPYTFGRGGVAAALDDAFVLTKTQPIFSRYQHPVVSVIWSYTGLPATRIAQRLSVQVGTRAQRPRSTISEHIESTSYDSFGVIKVFSFSRARTLRPRGQLTAVPKTI